MEQMKRLFGAKSESEESTETLLLSQILELRHGYIPHDELQLILRYASDLQALPEPRRPGETAWLADFIATIGRVMAAERELDDKVAARARGAASTSTFTLPQSSAAPVIEEVTEEARPTEPKTSDLPRVDTLNLGRKESAQSLRQRPLPPVPAPVIKMNELVLKPEKFDGKKGAARQWLEEYEAASDANGWSDAIMRKYFAAFLTGTAKNWYLSMVQPSITAYTVWSDLRRQFVRFFIGPEELDALREELRRTRQRKDELASDFIARVMRIMITVDPTQSERERVKEIRLKLKDSYQDKMIGQKPRTIVELNDLVLEIEERLESLRSRREYVKQNDRGSTKNNKSDTKKPGESKDKRESKSKPTAGKSSDSKPVCPYCKKPGHKEETCWTKHGRPGDKKKTAAAAVTQETEPSKPKIVTVKNVCSVVGVAGQQSLECILHEVRLNKKAVQGMIDTGSKLSLIRADVAEELGVQPDGVDYNLVGADSRPLQCLGKAKIKIAMTIGKITKIAETEFVVVQDLCIPALLGWQLLGWFEVSISLAKRSITFDDAEAEEPPKKRKTGVRTKKPVELPPRSQTVVSATVPDDVPVGTVVSTIPFNFGNSLLVANSVSRVQEDHEVNCLVVNLEPNSVHVGSDTQIASFDVVASSEDATVSCVAATMQVADTEEFINVGDQLTEQQLSELKAVVDANLEAFSIAGQIGETNVIEHVIELTSDAKPFVEPLRRRPHAHKLEANRQVQHMLAEGIIEPCSGPWASAYVLVKKKTGDMRLCIDFRKLNAFTKADSYPLPNIEDCLEPLSGNVFFSQLDLASGYWQIKMEDNSRDYTGFRTDEGFYRFRRMPFGVRNGTASFMRLVNALFAGLKGVHLQVFIDDICVASKTWSEHLSILAKVFALLKGANLKLKASKCTFGASKVVFLGHELSAEGIQQERSKMLAIQNMPAPRNVHEVRRVLGLFGYYRRFVPGFSVIAEPLTRLMKKDRPFEWTDEQKRAFAKLKEEFSKDPILKTFDQSRPVVLKTDASRVGVAGILLQQFDSDWHMITCCSRRLSSAEENYGISDLEGLAVVYCVTKLRPYLLGKHFTILVDHCALCALKDKLPNSPRLRRWALLLSEYDFSIKYVRGGLHRDVDCLSRAPVNDEVDAWLDDKLVATILAATSREASPQENRRVAVVVARDNREWKALTEADPEAQDHLAKARSRQKGYKIYSGLLYYENRLYVPKEKRQDLIAENHSDVPACHGGVRATIERMAAFWWPTMASDVRQFVASCPICQARKADNTLPAGSMHSFVAHEPFQLVAIDALGPLPASLAGMTQVFVAVDCFTRFVIAEATEDVRAATFVKFMKNYIGKFGPPQCVITDNAPTFVNRLADELFSKYHISTRRATPHHHQGNAMAERVIRTVQEKLALITHDPAATVDWEDALGDTLLSINTTVHSSTGLTPFELVFGRQHAARTDSAVTQRSPQQQFAELRELRTRDNRARAIAAQSDSRQDARRHFDKRHRLVEFSVGQLVLSRVIGRRAKLQNRFVGPYRVLARENDIYTIESADNRREQLQRHASDLKPYLSRQDDEESSSEDEDRRSDDDNSSSNLQNQSSVSLTSEPQPSTSNQPTLVSCLIQIKQTSISEVTESMRFKHLLILLLVVSPASAKYEFKEGPLVSWLPTKTFVSSALTHFKLLGKFGPPCQILTQFQSGMSQVDEGLLATKLCQTGFTDLVINRIDAMTSLQGSLGLSTNQQLTNLIQKAAGLAASSENTVTQHQTSVVSSKSQAGSSSIGSNQYGQAAASSSANHYSQNNAAANNQYSQSAVAAGNQYSQGAAASGNPYSQGNAATSHQQAMATGQAAGAARPPQRGYGMPRSYIAPADQLGALMQTGTGEGRVEERGVLETCAICFASNILGTVVDRVIPNPKMEELKERQHVLERKVEELNANLTFSQLELQAVAESQTLTAELVQHNVAQIHALQFTFPSLAIVSSNVMAKLHLTGAYLDKLRVSFRSHKPDLETLALLFQYDDLLDIDPESIPLDSIKISSPGYGLLQIEFSGHRRSKDLTVYQVNSFGYWGDLLDRPKLYHYAGPRYVLRDEKHNCTKGISPPTASYITAQCNAKNYLDHRLSSWKVVKEEGKMLNYTMEPTEMIEIWPSVLVYCYPHEIELLGHKEACPPFPFQPDARLPWKTATFEYNPDAIEVNFVDKPVPDLVTDFKDFHFANGTHLVDTNAAVNRVRELNKKIMEMKSNGVVLTIAPDQNITYEHSTFCLIMLLGAGLIVELYLMCCAPPEAEEFDRRDAERRRQEATRREAAELRRHLNAHYQVVPRREGRVPMITWEEV